jgi:hypothetical protein
VNLVVDAFIKTIPQKDKGTGFFTFVLFVNPLLIGP